MHRVFIIDHDDSFTDTIVSYFQQLGVATKKVHYLDPILLDLKHHQPSALILSPGPGHPLETKETLHLIQQHFTTYPILGICLGMQAIAVALGGEVVLAKEVMHGKLSPIYHQKMGLFEGLPMPFSATRYHSLMVEKATLPDALTIDAWTFDSQQKLIPMGIRHAVYPVFGVQFHPEAILSEQGFPLFRNFLALCRD